MKKKFTQKEYADFKTFSQLLKKLPKYLKSMGDPEGIDIFSAEIIKGCFIDEKGNLRNAKGYLGEPTDNCFVNQHTGYIEDDFYGDVYFATPINGEYIKFYYHC